MAHPLFSLSLEEALLLLGQQLGARHSANGARKVLDDLASKAETAKASASDEVAVLQSAVYEQGGFRGNREDYYAPSNAFFADAVASKRGLPITLAAILASVGNRTGIAVQGIAFPGHFLARVGGSDGVLIDPFNEGNRVTNAELEQLAMRFLGDASLIRDEHLLVASDEDIVVRSLINLQHAYRKRGLFAQAMLVSDKLVELTGSPEHIRDRGLLAIALGSNETAEGDLSAYLAARPQAKDGPTLRVALEQLRRSPKKDLQ